MFKNPVNVNIDIKSDDPITHTVKLDDHTARLIRDEVDNAGAHACALIVIAGVVTTASAIAIHIAKTKIK